MSTPPAPCTHLQAFTLRKPGQLVRPVLLARLAQACFGPHPKVPLGHVVCTGCGALCGVADGVREHAAAAGEGHCVCVDVPRAELYCALCEDYVYDASFDQAVVVAQQQQLRQHAPRPVVATASPPPVTCPTSPNGAAAAAGQHTPRRHSAAEGLATHLRLPSPPPAEFASPPRGGDHHAAAVAAPPGEADMLPVSPETPPLGVRGLNNLGNTCFMASVLQAHFLAGGHCSAVCRARCATRPATTPAAASAAPGAATATAAAPCLACELDSAFQAAFRPSVAPGAAAAHSVVKGDTRAAAAAAAAHGRCPWSPDALLFAWWRHADSLASYQQQDAHEFLLTLIAGAHAAVAPSRAVSSGGGVGGTPRVVVSTPRGAAAASWASLAPDACGCPMHATLAGVLRSEVQCATCGSVSAVCDPFLDLSLEVTAAGEVSVQRGGAAQQASSPPVARLSSCLRRFTRRESLGPGEHISCGTCGTRQPGTKHMCVDRLPPVLCLHIKRFSHAGAAGKGGSSGGRGGGGRANGGDGAGVLGGAAARGSSKVTTHVAFPLDCLNMAPYTAQGLAADAHLRAVPRLGGEGVGGGASSDAGGDVDGGSKYWCAAVVCHLGSMDGGHYVAYVRHHGQWFKCDDSWVTPATPEEVAASQAYLLFYAAHGCA